MMGNSKLRVACVVPTYNGSRDLERLLSSLENQKCKFDVFVVDSSSSDGTLEVAKRHVRNVFVIPSAEFNHGGTRQMMVESNPDYDIFVFLTQDAYLADADAIMNLVAYFEDPRIGAVCGRQLPHLDANPLAAHARFFNYPAEPRVKGMEDVGVLGIKTPFMSNSFSAYRGAALNSVGGFPKHVILSEDMYVAAKMLLADWKVAYAADAVCHHSHNYTLREEFVRYFDQGVFHARESWVRKKFGGAGGEGRRFVISELKFLGLGRLHQWPGSIIRNALKLVGFKLGLEERRLPIRWKRKISMHRKYWDGPFA
jgi:rhamnosyltransferase